MAELEDKRHEAFARMLATGMDQHVAYAKAGFRPDPSRSNASKMAKKVSARVEELRAERSRLRLPASELSGHELVKVGIQGAMEAERWTDVAKIGLDLGEHDGSLAALNPTDSDKTPDSKLAQDLLPSFKVFLYTLGHKIPPEDKLLHAVLCAIGNAGALGFTDGAGNPVPIDNPNKHNGGTY